MKRSLESLQHLNPMHVLIISTHCRAFSTSTCPQDEAEGLQLTGDWNGQRKNLSDKGLDIAIIYKGEANNASQGIHQKTVFLQNLDVRLLMDLEKMFSLKGTSIFIYGLGSDGGDHDKSPSKNVGDIQGSSNIEEAQTSLNSTSCGFNKPLLMIALHF